MLLDEADREFSKHIQVLLNCFILNSAEILAIMHVEYPVHCLHCPLHSGVMKQLLRRQLSAGDIVVPFVCFLPVLLDFRPDCADTGEIFPLFLPEQPGNIADSVCRPCFNPVAVFLFFDCAVHPLSECFVLNVVTDFLQTGVRQPSHWMGKQFAPQRE